MPRYSSTKFSVSNPGGSEKGILIFLAVMEYSSSIEIDFCSGYSHL
jgi:hypothetical protein